MSPASSAGPGAAGLTHHASRLGPLLPVLALVVLATWPLLTAGLPTVGDGLIHFHRLAELERHVRQGDLYPRWFADLHYGFGAPVLNFYAPLSYYVALLPRLLGLPLPTALQVATVLAMSAAIFGAYAWARDRFGSPLAGTTAAAAYGLAPYLYLNILHRGAYPETWALALAPWILWSAGRLRTALSSRPSGPEPDQSQGQGAVRARLAMALLYTALILTHTVSALIFTPVLILYLALLSLGTGRGRAVFRHASIAIGHALALCAFFVLPVLLEAGEVQLFRTFLPGDLDYRRNFLAVPALLSPPVNFDPRLVFNRMPASLAWPQVALALLALLPAARAAIRGRPSAAGDGRFVVGLWILALGVCFFALSLSAPVWAAFPLARFVQFPWRLVGPAGLIVAGLAGAGARSALLRRAAGPAPSRVEGTVAIASILAFFLFSLPWTYHAGFNPLPASVGPADAIEYEIRTGQLGTTSAGEFLPRWVSELPAPETLLPRYEESDTPSRLAPLPATVAASVARGALRLEELTYSSPSPFTATFYRFYFPGWRAALDGVSTPIRVSAPGGLITVPLPAGQHSLRLALGPTLPQVAGALVSASALAALIVQAFRRRPAPRAAGAGWQPAAKPRWRFNVAITSSIVLLLAGRVIYLDRYQTPLHRTSLGSLPNPLAVNFDNQLELIAFEHPPALAPQGGELTLYWRALAPLQADYATTVQLADRFGNRFGGSDSQHPGGVPTSRWALDQYGRDAHRLLSLAGTPPGQYRLVVGVYSSAGSLSVLDQAGAPAGVEYDLGMVAVLRAPPEPPGPLRLVEWDVAAEALDAGDRLSFTAVWNSGSDPLPPLAARLSLTAANGQPVFSADLPPAGPDYPSDQWGPNELVRYPYSLDLPPALAPGPVRLWLALLRPDGSAAAGPFDLGPLAIRAPERSYNIPPMGHRVDHDFGGAIRLLGYDLAPGSITLYWQSLAPVSARLTVFVHALDPGGAFLDGYDSPPPRPTSGWLPGEVLADAKPFAVGDRFEVGLYDPATGERFGQPFATSR